MSVRGEVRCDRCSVAVETSAQGLTCKLPEGWVALDWTTHCCAGCATREELEQRTAAIAHLQLLLGHILEDEAEA